MSHVTDVQERLGTRCFTFWWAFVEETNIVLGVAREYSRLSPPLVARNVLQQTPQLGSVRWSVYRNSTTSSYFFVKLFAVEIICDVITGAFEVSSKGGDGHKGQDGGPGADAPDSSVIVSFFHHGFVKEQVHAVCYRFKKLKRFFLLVKFQKLWSEAVVSKTAIAPLTSNATSKRNNCSKQYIPGFVLKSLVKVGLQ